MTPDTDLPQLQDERPNDLPDAWADFGSDGGRSRGCNNCLRNTVHSQVTTGTDIQEHDAFLGELIMRHGQMVCRRRHIPEVEAWLAEVQGFDRRRHILVLEGPSGIGKTWYGLSLFGWDTTLQVGCLFGNMLNFGDYDIQHHRAIMLDDGTPQMLAQTRWAFHSPQAWIMTSYVGVIPDCCRTFCLNRVPLIVTSNNWGLRLQQLSPEDRAWVLNRTCHIYEQEKLWVDPEPPIGAL